MRVILLLSFVLLTKNCLGDDDSGIYNIFADTRLTKDLRDSLKTFHDIGTCDGNDDTTSLTQCLTEAVGEVLARKLITHRKDIHLIAEVLNTECEKGDELVACYKTEMNRQLKCVHDKGITTAESVTTDGLNLFAENLHDSCDTKRTHIIAISDKLKVCNNIDRCIHESTISAAILYGPTLSRLHYFDKLFCRSMKRYGNCFMQEMENCESWTADDAYDEEALNQSFEEFLAKLGCTSVELNRVENVHDERFQQLKTIEVCFKALTIEERSQLLPSCAAVPTVINKAKDSLQSDPLSTTWINVICENLQSMEGCVNEIIAHARSCLRLDEPIFNQNGTRIAKVILENFCKDNATEFKKLYSVSDEDRIRNREQSMQCRSVFRENMKNKMGVLADMFYIDEEVVGDINKLKKCFMGIYNDHDDLKAVVKNLFEVADELKED